MDRLTFKERRDLAERDRPAQSPQATAKILQFRRRHSAAKDFKTGQPDDWENESGPVLGRGPWLAF